MTPQPANQPVELSELGNGRTLRVLGRCRPLELRTVLEDTDHLTLMVGEVAEGQRLTTLTRRHIAAMLPYLIRFAATGELAEPSPWIVEVLKELERSTTIDGLHGRGLDGPIARKFETPEAAVGRRGAELTKAGALDAEHARECEQRAGVPAGTFAPAPVPAPPVVAELLEDLEDGVYVRDFDRLRLQLELHQPARRVELGQAFLDRLDAASANASVAGPFPVFELEDLPRGAGVVVVEGEVVAKWGVWPSREARRV